MKLVSLVALSALSLPAASTLASESTRSPLEGRWALDIAAMANPPGELPRQVTLEFKDAGSGKWHSRAEIEFADGRRMTADATPPLDGTPTPIVGNYYANQTTLRLPAPNTLVMQLVDHGTPSSTRVFTVAKDTRTMTETKAYFSKDGQPVLQTFTYKRLP